MPREETSEFSRRREKSRQKPVFKVRLRSSSTPIFATSRKLRSFYEVLVLRLWPRQRRQVSDLGLQRLHLGQLRGEHALAPGSPASKVTQFQPASDATASPSNNWLTAARPSWMCIADAGGSLARRSTCPAAGSSLMITLPAARERVVTAPDPPLLCLITSLLPNSFSLKVERKYLGT
jgi:hypothetical protein